MASSTCMSEKINPIIKCLSSAKDGLLNGWRGGSGD